MKNILFFLLLFTGIVNGQIVNIPDANFKAKLLTSLTTNQVAKDLSGNYFKIDSNSDGEIQMNEVLNVSALNVSFSNISDLTGIEFFTSLNKLEVYNNQITSIDITALVNLNYLNCRVNQLIALDVNTLTNLTNLDFYANNITSINISSLVNLNYLNCGYNEISTINLTSLINLEHFDADHTQISTLDLSTLVNLKHLILADYLSIVFDLSNLINLRELVVRGCNLTSLDVTHLVNLTKLDCYNNDLMSLNINALNNLVELDCSANHITSLDVSNMENLKLLDCKSNDLTTLNVSNCTNLEKIECGINLLTNLDVSGLTNLQILFCSFNNLTMLNNTGCSMLLHLNCSGNQITALDLPSLTSLEAFNGGFNPYTVLDFSNCPLSGCYIFNGDPYNSHIAIGTNPNLEIIILKNGTQARMFGQPTTMAFTNLPNLKYICIDENSDEINQVLPFIPASVSLNSYCSFTPGGDFNTITGSMRYDLLNDGCDNDTSSLYLKVKINDGNNIGTAFTNTTGNYTFYTQAGNFTLTPEVENSSYFNFSPANAVLNFPVVDNSTQTQNFCITANGVHPDIEVTFVPLNNARPGFDAHYKIVYKNKGTQTLSGNIKLNYDSSKLDFISTFPDDNFQTNPNEISWNYNTLQPFETRDITLTLNVLTPPTVNDGDILNFTTTINPIAADETPLDNVFVLNQTVVNSYDPNQIECLEGNIITPEEVGNYLHYNINFENVGTADAINIVVKDTINTAKFNLNSLQLQYASHHVETKVTGNIVEFIFKNIHLQPSNGGPIGGHGNVLFKIKTLPNLVVGDEVMGSANIFFDYNAPIATNEERTVIATLSKPDFIRDESITIAPNPAKNDVNIQSKNNIKSILFFDAQGRLLQTVLENKNSITLDISNHASGVYFLKVITEVGSNVEKIVKEN